MSLVTFGTKAETLERLAGILKSAKVLPQIRFTAKQWNENSKAILEEVSKAGWFDEHLMARSSAIGEDGPKTSLAGHYESVGKLRGSDSIRKGVERVIASFENIDGFDQVFLQPMLVNVKLSGVAFSKDPNTGSPYVVINYDDESGDTNTVTSGQTNELKTLYVFKGKKSHIPDDLKKVIELIDELEIHLGTDCIDVEFAISGKNELYLFQVRSLQVRDCEHIDFEGQQKALGQVRDKLVMMMRRHPYLHGQKTVFGIMPDWNPAEIIGVRPYPLALSLYKELITDNIWAYQRDNYGYKNLRSFPLLISFSGLPYIDVRVSFNSFIPEDVNPDLSEKLVNYYISCLIDSPSYHDKVEFEIIFSCYSLDLPKRLEVLRQHGFSGSELSQFSDSLRVLTNKIIHGDRGLWKADIERIEKLEHRRKAILESDLDKVSKIYWLLEDCKRYGTLPFAGLARAGFIAVQLLKSLVKVGILNEVEYEEFMGQLETVSSQSSADFDNLSRTEFLEMYGHLRPGTYDILSPRYDEDPDRYFNWKFKREHEKSEKPSFRLSLDQMKCLEALLVEHKLEHSALGLFEFIKGAIEGREYSKFVFTRSLSDALFLFKELSVDNNFSLEDCAFADVETIRTLYASSAGIKDILKASIEEGKSAYNLTKQIILPPLLVSPDDVWAFHLPICEPNFITMQRARGSVVNLVENSSDLTGKILFIKSADPGYDWIFSRGIIGFITMYGGVNSHMAIRAGELGIPAVIGAGEVLYDQWSKGKSLEIDCANRQVKVLR
jgi:phosphohistidine swiveling domain-containing protein